MIRITQMKLPITHTEEQLQKKITKTLRLGNTPFTYQNPQTISGCTS